MTDALFFNEAMKKAVLLSRPLGEIAVFTRPSPTRDDDEPNQDAAAVISFGDANVIAVADGVGGGPGGHRAANLALEELAAAISEQQSDPSKLRDAVLTGFDRANNAVASLGIGAATTLAVVTIEDSQIRTFHVGDSEILVVGQRGRVKLQTIKHSPVGYAVEAGLINEQDALHHEDRHLISNLVGTAEMSVELGPPLKLARRDTVVIGSDGLFDNLYTEEIVECIRKGPCKRAAVKLADHSTARMSTTDPNHPSKPDDLTFILFRPHRAFKAA